MADPAAARQSPLAQLGIEPLRLRSVALEGGAPAVRFLLRGGAAAAAAVEQGFGVALPRQPCRAASAGPRAALWLGPDEWLLLAADDGLDAKTLAGAVGAPLAAVPHSLVDVSHRQAALILSGRDAATALNGGCPLDLSATAFPVGMCTRTLFGKAEIVLWRTQKDRFHIEVWRSFTAYVAGLLALTCRDAASLSRGG